VFIFLNKSEKLVNKIQQRGPKNVPYFSLTQKFLVRTCPIKKKKTIV